MPKVVGALALWSTLAGFAMGWIGDSSKVLLTVKNKTPDAAQNLHAHMERLHDQIVRILRIWVGCAALSALTLVVSCVSESLKTNYYWAIGGALLFSLLIHAQVRFYQHMESILRQRFEIEDFAISE